MESTRLIQHFMTLCPHSIGLEQTAGVARAMMRKLGIHHLPVQSGGRLVGIVSDRDITFAEAWSGSAKEDLPIEDIYTPDPYVVQPNTPLGEALRHMVRDQIGCVLVQSKDKLVGIFTTTDACRELAKILDGEAATKEARAV